MGLLDTIKGALSGSSSGGSGDSVLGVDIGTSSIKVVQLRKDRGRAVLETYGEIALGPYAGTEIGRATHLDPTEIQNALRDVVTEANVTAKKAGFAIPFSSSLTAVIDFPKLPASQLESMIPLEARKYIPLPINEVTLDWFLIPDTPLSDEWSRSQAAAQKDEIKKQQVLLVAIHNETLSNYQTIVAGSNLAAGFYELEVFSVVRSGIGHGIAPVMIVDVGAATTKVYIVERGIVRTSHLINIGSQELTLSITRSLGWSFERAERIKREQGIDATEGSDAQQADQVKNALLSTLGRMMSEINRVLLNYEKKHGQNVSRAILAGGGSALPGFAAYVSEHMSIAVEAAHPFEKVQAPAFLNEVLAEVGPEFAVAVGVALRRMQDI